MTIKAIDDATRKSLEGLLTEEWGGPLIVTRGQVHDLRLVPGFVVSEEDELKGVVFYHIDDSECEIVLLEALEQHRGFGSALVERVVKEARERGCVRVWLITTNDNAHAIRYYQRHGFALKAVHIDALKKSRELKPQIPLTGMDDIPLLHEFEFEMRL